MSFPKVVGCCPMGCGETLFLADGGHVTCSWTSCPDPTAADTILCEQETEHIVTIEPTRFHVQHPLRERLNGELHTCELHQWLSDRSGPPAAEGRYRVVRNGPSWTFEVSA